MLRTITSHSLATAGRMALSASSGAGAAAKPSPEFHELAETLRTKKGQTLGEHVMADLTPAAKVAVEAGECPFLSKHPVVSRTALRESNARTYARRFPFAIAKADIARLEDVDGNVYLDALGVAGTLALGHNHPVVLEAATKFLASGQPMQTLDMSSPVKDEFVSTLIEALPAPFAGPDGSDVRLQFCGPAGTDVTEAAVKIATTATGRSSVISFHGAYHGHTLGALSLMGNLDAKSHVPYLRGGVQFAPYPYPYRCPFGLGDDGASVMSQYFERMLDDVESGVTKPAAVILEAVQGEGGVIPAPPEWLAEVRRITAERGILLIVDEIQTGFGRTGTMFAHEEAGIVPDLLCMSKAIGGGMPLGVVAYKADLDAEWKPGMHAGTFRGNQLAMATGTATLRHLMDNDMPGRTARRGAAVLDRLNDLKARTPLVGDVRGRGFMIGVELVDPAGTPDPCLPNTRPPASAAAAAVQMACLERGMIIEKGGRGGATMRFLPPLATPDDDLDEMLNIFTDAVEYVAANHS